MPEFDFETTTPARQPTEEEWAAAVDEAQAAYEQLQTAVLIGRAAMWAMAEACWLCNERNAWLKLGVTKGEFLAQPEVHLTRDTFDRFVRVWDRTVVTRHVDAATLQQLDVTKVDIVLPAVTRARVSIADALEDAKVLGAHDLREKYQGIPSPADPPLIADGDGAGDGKVDMQQVIAVDEAVEAIEAAWQDVREAYESGTAYPRVHRDSIGWLVFDDECRPPRSPDLIALKLEVEIGNGEAK